MFSLLLLPFEKAIRQWILYSPGAELSYTYTFFFGIAPKIIFILLSILLLISRKLIPQHTLNKSSKILLYFYIFASISSLLHGTRLIFIATGYISLFIGIFYYFVGYYFSQNILFYKFIRMFIITLTIFCVYIGGWQLINQHPMGKFIELTPSFATKGYTTTDGTPQFRVSGFISHPVYFGSFLCILLASILFLSFDQPFLLIIAAPLIAVILGTLSRTTWINLFLIFSLFFIYWSKHPNFVFSKRIKKTITIIFVIIISMSASIVVTRIKSIFTLSDPSGSLMSRISINLNGIKIASSFPFIGVGLNNFAFEAKQQGLLQSFSAPPHNTVLIFLTELGFPVTITFVLFLFFLIKPTNNPFNWSPYKFGLWVSLLTFMISSQFHPLFNLDPTFQLFLFIAGVFSSLCKPSKT